MATVPRRSSTRIGRPVSKIDKGDSAAPTVEEVAAALDADAAITHVWIIHCETTSGIVNPIQDMAKMVKAQKRVFMVDAMSSFGALPLDMMDGLDVMVSSSNKCIEGVPGFSYVLVKRDMLEGSKGRCHSVVLDLHEQWKGLEANGQFRFTPPTHALVAFHQAHDANMPRRAALPPAASAIAAMRSSPDQGHARHGLLHPALGQSGRPHHPDLPHAARSQLRLRALLRGRCAAAASPSIPAS